MIKWLVEHIKQKPFELSAVFISIGALIFSILSYQNAPQRHSDILTSDVIREAYNEFINMADIRATYPLHGHLYSTPINKTPKV